MSGVKVDWFIVMTVEKVPVPAEVVMTLLSWSFRVREREIGAPAVMLVAGVVRTSWVGVPGCTLVV